MEFRLWVRRVDVRNQCVANRWHERATFGTASVYAMCRRLVVLWLVVAGCSGNQRGPAHDGDEVRRGLNVVGDGGIDAHIAVDAMGFATAMDGRPADALGQAPSSPLGPMTTARIILLSVSASGATMVRVDRGARSGVKQGTLGRLAPKRRSDRSPAAVAVDVEPERSTWRVSATIDQTRVFRYIRFVPQW